MKRRIVITILVLAVLGVGGWFGYNKFFRQGEAVAVMAEGPEGAPVVQVETVSRQLLVQEVFSPGVLEAGNLQEFKAPVESPRVSVKVELGQAVEAGQLLVELDSAELEEKVKSQELQLLKAENNLEELRRDLESAPLQLDKALQEARQQLIEAQTELARKRAEAGGEDGAVGAARTKIDQLRRQAESAQRAVDEARQALAAAEAAYLANPGDKALADAHRKAEEAYREAVTKNQETARETAGQLAEAEAELEALLQTRQGEAAGDDTDVRLAEIQVSLAEAAVREAEEALRRGPDLEQLQVAEAEVEAARATLEKLRSNLESTRIVATEPGVVLYVGVKEGDPVQQGSVLVRVGDMERMELVGQVEAVDLDSIEPGQKIMVTSPLLPLANFEGQVTGVGQQTSQSGDPMMRGPMMGESVTFEVRGEVINTDGRLKSGMSAEMRIETSRRENALVVPLLAVREEAGQAFVLVVKDYTVEVRPIQTGLVTNRQVEVLSGLEEGEQIIVAPFGLIETLQDGDPVRIEVAPEMGPGMEGPGMGGPVGGRGPGPRATRVYEVPAGRK